MVSVTDYADPWATEWIAKPLRGRGPEGGVSPTPRLLICLAESASKVPSKEVQVIPHESTGLGPLLPVPHPSLI